MRTKEKATELILKTSFKWSIHRQVIDFLLVSSKKFKFIILYQIPVNI